MGINKQSDLETNLQIGPTDQGMVRIFVAAGDAEIPMDFHPEEAEEIAQELQAAENRALASTFQTLINCFVNWITAFEERWV